MVNLFLMISSVFASDVYEICRQETQLWNERDQVFVTQHVSTFYSRQGIQMIIHNKTFEVDRDVRPIQETFKKDDMNCWREHKNSFFCHDTIHNTFLLEFYRRNGDVTRDVMLICSKNGEPV